MKYLLAIGSNIKPEIHVRSALNQCLAHFDAVWVGRFYTSPAHGMQSNRVFWNGAIAFESSLSAAALKVLLCRWEGDSGRDRAHPECSKRDRTLDLDLLWCEDSGWLEPLHHVQHTAYVFLPLASLLGLRSKQRLHLRPKYFSFRGQLLGGRRLRLRVEDA